MKPILKEKLGSNISIIDLLYYQPYRHKGEYPDDLVMVVYKDENGKKKVASVPKPEIDIYFTKPEYRHEWRMPREHVEFEKVFPVTCRYKYVLNEIAKEMKTCNDPRTRQLLDIYKRSFEVNDYRAKKEIYKWQHTFMSDLPIEDYYRVKLITDYNTDFAHQIKRAFLDIESDVYGLSSNETAMDEDRTNAVTVIFDPIKSEDKPQVYTYLLRDHIKYQQQKYFEKHLDEFSKECHDNFDVMSIVRNGKRIKRDNYADYHIEFFDTDGELISAIFDLINRRKPDTLGVWNIAYDFPKMHNRLIKNGLNPKDIMSDKAFPEEVRFIDMSIDNRPGVEISDRKTYIRLTSTVKPYDQMGLYAGTRKGGKAYGSSSLDNIATLELGINKREFNQIGVTVLNAAVKEYWNFILYNINDVWLQRLTDDITNDTLAYFIDSNTAGSAMENVFKQTRYQKTIYYAEKLRKGYVSGNNVNIDYVRGIDEDIAEAIEEMKQARSKIRLDDDELEDDEIDQEVQANQDEIMESVINVYNDSPDRKIIIKGGLVGDPNLKTANGMELIKGVPSKHFFDYNVDMDYASEYPWAKITRSISKSTQFGRLIIEERISKRQNELNDPMYLPGGEFVADYISGDTISLGKVWFNLPSIDDMIEELEAM